jgi:hypothetical protein
MTELKESDAQLAERLARCIDVCFRQGCVVSGRDGMVQKQ